ncbi:MAG: oligosaccharide flippase family protein [Bacteroidales bacterium]|nr:oligosaccharide flippase family protein [Bacteroidales bacterium]
MITKFKKLLRQEEFLSFAGNLSYAALGFISFVLLTRSFDKTIFGQWVLFVTTASFIEMFRFGLTRTAMVRFLAGADIERQKSLIGSNWLIGIIVSGIIIIPVFIINYLFKSEIEASGFGLFFEWYPLLAIVTLPFNNALTVLQAQLAFGKILILRIFNIIFFDLFLILNLFLWKFDVSIVVYAFLFFNLFTSLLSLIKGWDGIKYLFKSTKETSKEIFHFGKFTLATLIGSNILKSADAFIIGLSPILGAEGVALYSVPLKLTEVMEIPLRSMAATSFPKMAKASSENNLNKVRDLFYTYTGALTLLFIPFSIFNFVFADFFVQILGGKQYLSTAIIYQAFCIYGLILPLDRFTGVGLDTLNLPKYNMYKVIFMVVSNIIGDLIAVFVFESIFGVALITILMTLVGILIGNYYFNKSIPFNYSMVFKSGWLFYKNLYTTKILKH